MSLALVVLASSAIAHPPLPQADLFGFLRSAPAASAERVLLIDIDDVGFDLLRDTPTPNLDMLESTGRFFEAFRTSPICSPTRAMLQMGAYASHPRLRLGNNIRVGTGYHMPLGSLVTLPQLVTAEGRSVAKIGKWHLSPRLSYSHPNDAGWTYFSGVMSNVPNVDSFSSFDLVTNGVPERRDGVYLTTLETDQGIGFVRSHTDLVSVSYHAPHSPFHVPPADLHTIDPVTSDRDMARAMLQACDHELGRLVRAGMEEGYTILVFSDNGTAQSIGGGKGTLFEIGTHTPMWAIGPGVTPGIDASRVHVVDIYDTVAELLGIDASGANRGPNSESFVRQLRGHPRYRRWSYSERFQQNGVDPHFSTTLWRRSLRGERYKLIREPHAGGRERFYDLLANPSESFDLLLGQQALSPSAQAALDYFRDVLAGI